MNSGDRGSNFILITRVHSTFYTHLRVFFIVLVNFVLLLWYFFVYVCLFGVFFLFLFRGDVYRPAEVCGRFWVGNKRRKNKQNKTKHFLIKIIKKKRGGHSSSVFLFVHSEWFSNGKMKLKNDICIKILNDRYRPIIDLYVFKKKQTNKQKQKNHVSVKISDLKEKSTPQQTKKQTKIKTKQNNNNTKGNDDLKGKKWT